MPEPSTKPEPAPVVAAIVTSDKGVLVGRRNDGKPPWTFIAGEIEPGESPADAAVREVKEETGCVITACEVIGRRVHPKTSPYGRTSRRRWLDGDPGGRQTARASATATLRDGWGTRIMYESKPRAVCCVTVCCMRASGLRRGWVCCAGARHLARCQWRPLRLWPRPRLLQEE